MTIDVIVPVYEGADETRRALASVLASRNDQAFELVVVDDATPNAGISQLLTELATSGRATVLRNPVNAGFVRSANLGMALHPGRDVILLNSDTEVAGRWLDRLAAAANSGPRVGTVTPLSNNATICSYPYEGWTGGVPGTLGLEAFDRLVSAELAGRTLPLPTAVGFCMYIRGECRAQVGDFDAAAFGQGYGEENDFSLRAAKAGWSNLLACDVFVFHQGSVSFAESRHALMAAGTRALLERHPDYGDLVRAFIDADALRPVRDAIDRARARLGGAEAEALADERSAERATLAARLREAAAFSARVEAALADAQGFVEQRTGEVVQAHAALAERDHEIGRLHDALDHAASLAHARERELIHIKSYSLWRYYSALLRRFGPEPPAAP